MSFRVGGFSCVLAFAICIGSAYAQQSPKTKIVTQLGHGSGISSVSFSNDGNLAITGDDAGVVLVWDVRTGRMLKALRKNSDPVRSVRFSMDGRRALVSHWQSIRVWDLELDAIEREASAPEYGAFERGVFFPSEEKIVYANENLAIFNLQTGHALDFKKVQNHTVLALALSGDGRRVLTTSTDSILWWDALGGSVVGTLQRKLEAPYAAALSQDGSLAIFSSGKDLILRSLVGSASEKKLTGHKMPIWAAAMSPDNRLAVSGSEDKAVVVWDLAAGRAINTFQGNKDNIRAVAISRDGELVIAGGDDRVVRVWRVSTGQILHSFPGAGLPQPVLSQNNSGRLLFHSSETKRVSILDTHTGQIVRAFPYGASATALALSYDGMRAVAGTEKGEVIAWDVSTGNKIFSAAAHRSAISALALAKDSPRLISGGEDKDVAILDISGGVVQRIKGIPDTPKAVAVIDQGSTIVTLDRTCTIKKWSLSKGTGLGRSGVASPESTCLNAAISPSGKTALAGGDNNDVASVFDVDRNARLNITDELRALGGHRIEVSSVSFSPDGKLATSATSDGELKLWNTGTWELVRNLPSIPGGVVSTTFVGSLIAAMNSGGEVMLFNKSSEAVQVRHKVFADGGWITVTSEGFFDSSSPKAAQNLNVVRGLEVYSIDQVYQALYRPDLVREKLAGDPNGLVREAAAKLDLNKVIASGAAPRVSILAPASGGSVADDEVTIEASIVEQSGGGIGRIEWRINGVTLGVESRGLERLPEGAGSSPSRSPIIVKRTLSLEPGQNRIEMVAYNGRDLIASDPALVVLKWDGEKSATPPKLHVLAVGVNDYYDSRLKLFYAVPDAKALGDAMKQAGGSLYQSVEVTSVFDDKVTADNLDRVFTELGKKVHPRDVFVFFLAGHGKTVDGRYHFLPQNFRYEDESSIVKRGIDQERFQAWFAKISARKSILLYDTCESGSLIGERVQQRGIERVAALEKMTRAMGRTVLSASTDDAPALEGYRGHGVFTYALLNGLQAADTNGNGLIEVTELAAFIDQKVPDLSYQAFKMRQIPQMKIVGNSFPVVSKTTVLHTVSAQAVSKPSLALPSKPTHVVVSQSPVDVYVAAARSGVVVQQLPAGTLVTLVETANGWLLIAKDGKKLGFVEEKMLMPVQ